MEDRARQSEGVGPLARAADRDAIVRVRKLFEQEAEEQLAGHDVGQSGAQRGAVEAVGEDSIVDVVARRAEEAESPVVDVGAEGGVSGAVRPVAQRFDSGRRARPAERAEWLVDECPTDQERMVHQVAAHLIAGVGGGGHQQQLGVLHGVGGEHIARRQ